MRKLFAILLGIASALIVVPYLIRLGAWLTADVYPAVKGR